CDDRDVESSHEATLYPFSADSNGVSALTSGAESKVLTKAMIFSVLSLGQLAYSAHPRNFEAASSKLIGFAGLPLAKSARPVMGRRRRLVVISTAIDLFHLIRLYVVGLNQTHQFRHRGMCEGTRRIGLQRNARGHECPRLSQAIHDRRWIVRPSEGMEKAPIRFQNLLRCGPAQRNQISGHYSAFCGVPGLKRLGHGSEIFSQSA